MTNYYEKLKLNPSMSVAEINTELTKAERVWHQRETVNPEKATAMLVLIMEARQVFANENTKRNYDNALNGGGDAGGGRNDSFDEGGYQKWYQDALDYYKSGQYDLAKVAIEKSISQIGGDDERCVDVFCLATDIYRSNGESNTALNLINRAIVYAPTNSELYTTKALVLEDLANEENRRNGNNYSYYVSQMKLTLELAVNKASQSSDKQKYAIALGMLAFVLYNKGNASERQRAESLALDAVRNGGDPYGNAKRVLEDIGKERERKNREQQSAENARRMEAEKQEINRKQAIYEKAETILNGGKKDIPTMRAAIAEFSKIPDYRDAKEKIAYCNKVIQEINAERSRTEAERQRLAQEQKEAIDKAKQAAKSFFNNVGKTAKNGADNVSGHIKDKGTKSKIKKLLPFLVIAVVVVAALSTTIALLVKQHNNPVISVETTQAVDVDEANQPAPENTTVSASQNQITMPYNYTVSVDNPQNEEINNYSAQHTYYVVAADMSWYEAKAECEQRGGHLATVTTQEEYDKICALANDSGLKYIWLGARIYSTSDSFSEWITGESMTFSKWFPGEPSKEDVDGTEEFFLCLWNVNYKGNDIGWTFNDQRNDLLSGSYVKSGSVGYAIEYDN